MASLGKVPLTGSAFQIWQLAGSVARSAAMSSRRSSPCSCTAANPNALTAAFHLPDGTEPYVSMRMKLAGTSKVTALVQTDKGFFVTDHLVKVTLGGCGG